MLIDVVAVHVVQMPVVQIVDMIAMAYGRVPAVGAVLMRVIGVMRFLARRHGGLPARVIGAKLRRFGANDHPQFSLTMPKARTLAPGCSTSSRRLNEV